MGQYDPHVFVCTSGETCPTQGDTEKFVKILREGARRAGRADIRINKAGCFSQCGHGPMLVVYPENVWYAGVQESDLQEILTSHILGGKPVARLRYEPGVKGANNIDVEAKPAAAAPASGPQWKRVCRADEVPANGMKEFAVNGTSVLVVHTGADLVACQAMCPHEAVPLEQGVHDGCLLTCLEHTWQFDLKTGAPVGEAQEGVKMYRLRREGGDVYVALE
ncbi:MAG TPA: Rieske 2Fe-2S domain-containing protein [Methylomirabilota bacterium]|nr:Rieske 2Fe-2S domain-containing protein [Methylomirabilota bacterium]